MNDLPSCRLKTLLTPHHLLWFDPPPILPYFPIYGPLHQLNYVQPDSLYFYMLIGLSRAYLEFDDLLFYMVQRQYKLPGTANNKLAIVNKLFTHFKHPFT